MNDRELLLAVLVSRLGGRQVVTDVELAEAQDLRLLSQREGDAILLVASADASPQTPLPPRFHLEGEA